MSANPNPSHFQFYAFPFGARIVIPVSGDRFVSNYGLEIASSLNRLSYGDINPGSDDRQRNILTRGYAMSQHETLTEWLDSSDGIPLSFSEYMFLQLIDGIKYSFYRVGNSVYHSAFTKNLENDKCKYEISMSFDFYADIKNSKIILEETVVNFKYLKKESEEEISLSFSYSPELPSCKISANGIVMNLDEAGFLQTTNGELNRKQLSNLGSSTDKLDYVKLLFELGSLDEESKEIPSEIQKFVNLSFPI